MIIIEYAEHGQAVSDFNYKDWLDNVKANVGRDNTFIVSTSVPIYAVQLAIVRGELDCSKIVFKYSNEVFQANEYGSIPNRPFGFCDVESRLAEDILRFAMKKRCD
jgi:hypothetical protein